MKKILLIDDSEYIIEGTATVLRFEGYDVRTASSGAKGLELAHAFFPDLIICDVSMPEMDGFEVLRLLRSETSTDAIRFIFLTARADKEDMRMGMARGADDYLLKPFTVEELLAAINAQWKKTENIERKYDKIKTHISYALPHEFRTALNQIIGSARFLDSNRSSLESDIVPEITNDIIASAQRLLHISENFLVYAQLEAMGANPSAKEALRSSRSYEAVSVICDIVTGKSAQYERLNDLITSLDVEGVTLGISGENLTKIFRELVDNALKFSQPGSPVSVAAHLAPKHLVVSVKDKGRGMSAAEIADLGAYQQFNRMFHEQQGIGLGFVIASRLIEYHGGSLKVKSVEDEGTEIVIHLPLVTVDKPAEV